MTHYFITGSSSGIGRALCEELFQFKDLKVYGIARRQTLEHPYYNHHTIDLSETSEVSRFQFPQVDEKDDVILVNNAGTLGTVAKAGHLDEKGIERGFHVNLVSVAMLSNKFIDVYRKVKGRKVILNISSGAGKAPIDGWSVYCATKAGLDMFSRVLAEEQKLNKEGFHIFSVAPGIVDTEMQQEIRKADSMQFSRIEDFKRYKAEGELTDPQLISHKLMRILDHPEDFKETVFSVRDF